MKSFILAKDWLSLMTNCGYCWHLEKLSQVQHFSNCGSWGPSAIPRNVRNTHFLGSSDLHVCSVVCLTLGDPMDCSLPDPSVHGISQARLLEWVAISSSGRSSQPRYRTCISYISCIGRWILFHWVISDLLNQLCWVWSQHLALQQALMEILTQTSLRSTALVLACIPKQSSLSCNPGLPLSGSAQCLWKWGIP